jgi:glyoxylase-like metal-dependent hydrolase (beta-lactamase superfamily II)
MSFQELDALGVQVLERGWLSSNCVLIDDGVSASLVDSGYHTHANQTVQWVQQRLAGRSLHQLINTHLHSDHCGGNAALQMAYPQLLTSIPLSSEAAVRSWDSASLTYEATGQDCPPFVLNQTLNDGQIIRLGNWDWQVFTAKGHDPDSVVLFQADHSVLISADALWGNGFGVVFPELTGDAGFSDVTATLNMIESLSVRTVIPGHGPVFTDVKAALERARQRLAYFQQSPEKHIRHGLKVLIKFKLLEWKRVDIATLRHWCGATPHMRQHMPHAEALFDGWLEGLLDELARTGALIREGEWILDR